MAIPLQNKYTLLHSVDGGEKNVLDAEGTEDGGGQKGCVIVNDFFFHFNETKENVFKTLCSQNVEHFSECIYRAKSVLDINYKGPIAVIVCLRLHFISG